MNTLRLDPRAHIARIEDGTLDLSRVHVQTPAKTQDRRHKWLVSPYWDLFFVCGFAPWTLFLVAVSVFGVLPADPNMGDRQHSFNLAFLIASLLIGEAHQFTSVLRFLSQKRFWLSLIPERIRRSWKNLDPMWCFLCFTTIMVMQMTGIPVTGFAFAFVFFLPGVLGFLGVFLFPVVLMQHFVAQAKAIGLIYCGQNHYILSKGEQRVLSFAATFLVAAGACNIAMPFGMTGLLPAPWPFAINMLAALTTSALFFHFVRSANKNGATLPPSAACVWGNMALFVLLTPFLPSHMLYVWLFVPIFFHATQHWTLAWVTGQREARAMGIPVITFWQRALEFFRLVLPVQALSLAVLFMPALFGLVNKTQSPAELTLPLHWSLLVFYLHYFTDRIVWRARS